MIIPLGTTRPRQRRPHATGVIIVLNMLVYLVGLMLDVLGTTEIHEYMTSMGVSRQDLSNGSYWTLLTSQFAHSPDDIFHLAFNMLFLWIFGSSLEDRLGHVNFVLFYLMGGIVAGLAHVAETAVPAIGASGAVMAVTGGFVVLFPRTQIRILVIFFVIGIFMIPSLWVVFFFLAIDLIGILKPTSEVAHAAHLGGFIFGFLLCLSLVAVRIVKSDEYDLLYLFKQRRRRAAYRRVVSKSQAGSRVQTEAGEVVIPVLAVPDENPEEIKCRNQVMQLIRADKHEEAQLAFRDMQSTHPESVLPEAMQLDMANRLQVGGERDAAASAYDRFLFKYPGSRQAPEVRLLLASLLIRFLNRPTDARPLLEKAVPDLRSDGHRALALKLLNELGGEPAT